MTPKSPEWGKIVHDAQVAYEAFNLVRSELKEFYQALPFEKFAELDGKRQPKIVMKLFKYPGDITPAMLVSLVKDVQTLQNFLKPSAEEIQVSDLE